MTIEYRATATALKELKLNGAMAIVRMARKNHTCRGCSQTIERGTRHYCVYYGKGLGALKFPERYHVECL